MGAEIKYLSWSLFHPPSGISKTNRNASSHSSVAAEQGYKKAKHHRQNTSLSVTQKEVSHTYKHKPLARPFITLVLVIFWLKEFQENRIQVDPWFSSETRLSVGIFQLRQVSNDLEHQSISHLSLILHPGHSILDPHIYRHTTHLQALSSMRAHVSESRNLEQYLTLYQFFILSAKGWYFP